jgi:hypothetical protein
MSMTKYIFIDTSYVLFLLYGWHKMFEIYFHIIAIS